jgi:hypothetical protein
VELKGEQSAKGVELYKGGQVELAAQKSQFFLNGSAC